METIIIMFVFIGILLFIENSVANKGQTFSNYYKKKMDTLKTAKTTKETETSLANIPKTEPAYKTNQMQVPSFTIFDDNLFNMGNEDEENDSNDSNDTSNLKKRVNLPDIEEFF